MSKILEKEKELEKIVKKIKSLQKKRKALDSYIRLYNWRKDKENEK